MSKLPFDLLPLDRLPLRKLPLDRDQVEKLTAKARAGAQVAGALVATGRSLLQGLVRSGPKLIESAIGGAAHLAASTAHRLRSGDAFAPPLGEHQVSEVETERDAAPAPPVQPSTTGAVSDEAAAVGAPGSAADAVAKAVRKVADDIEAGEVMAHADLPLEDYDHLTIGSLRGRIRALDTAALVQLRSYERVHANRLPVMTALENRIAKLQAEVSDSGAPKATTG